MIVYQIKSSLDELFHLLGILENECISNDLSEIKKGDKIIIRTGAIIPVDGVIADGDAMINEASMTGESLAVHKSEGKAVHAGTVVEEGSIVSEVRSVNDQTRLKKILNPNHQKKIMIKLIRRN